MKQYGCTSRVVSYLGYSNDGVGVGAIEDVVDEDFSVDVVDEDFCVVLDVLVNGENVNIGDHFDEDVLVNGENVNIGDHTEEDVLVERFVEEERVPVEERESAEPVGDGPAMLETPVAGDCGDPWEDELAVDEELVVGEELLDGEGAGLICAGVASHSSDPINLPCIQHFHAAFGGFWRGDSVLPLSSSTWLLLHSTMAAPKAAPEVCPPLPGR